MGRLMLGWTFICYIVAICCVAFVWFSDNTQLMTARIKVEYSFKILFVSMLFTLFAIVIKLIINFIVEDIFKDEEGDYFVKKLK
ncbi:hypothetical protein A9G24_11345 [Gilliamella sp. App6-5]|uniref:hypothetical protein n=1 Tax=Gilliamella sp. App6-5 TaxID=3120232 RepID=UPI00080DBB72|nr:hypothetical protein [Gilliamella apicola]OCG18831.1 hypothetical protein A9G24_11345 [Gilliamella apicola]